MTAPNTGTTNEVQTPAGMTDAAFAALVVAKSGVASMLSDTNLGPALLASSQGWWDALGDYFREELLAQSTGELHAALETLAANGPTLLTITPEQDAAASGSVANAAAAVMPPVDAAPEAPPVADPAVVGTIAPVTLPFTVNASHAFDSLPAGSTATKTDGNTMLVEHGTTGLQSQQNITQGDTLTTLPNGSKVDILAAPVVQPVTSVAITLPANEHRSAMTIIGTDLHTAMANAWKWITDETLAAEAWIKKEL